MASPTPKTAAATQAQPGPMLATAEPEGMVHTELAIAVPRNAPKASSIKTTMAEINRDPPDTTWFDESSPSRQ
jgi:hypothetical protein